MSWLISQRMLDVYENSHCSQAPAAGFSADSLMDFRPFAPLNIMPTARPFWHNDKMTVAWNPSRFGLMCAHLTADHGEAVLTWYREAFLAKTSAPREKEPVSEGPGADCGKKWRESSVRFDLNTSSWKTHRCLFPEALQSSSLTLRRWGSMQNGVLLELITPEPLTRGIAYGQWPTPTVQDGNGRTHHNQRTGSPKLSLLGMAQKFPTPTASDASGPGWAKNKQGGDNLRTVVNGQLNPEWTEWLMGWPIGWTALEPLAMDKFREWYDSHGNP